MDLRQDYPSFRDEADYRVLADLLVFTTGFTYDEWVQRFGENYQDKEFKDFFDHGIVRWEKRVLGNFLNYLSEASDQAAQDGPVDKNRK